MQVIHAVLCSPLPDRTPPDRTPPELSELQVILDDVPGQIGDHMRAAVRANPGPTTAVKIPLTITAQGLHVGLSLMHFHKQRGRPPSSERGNICWRNQSGTVIWCISQVFQHHIVKSYRLRSFIRHQHADCVLEIARQDPNHRNQNPEDQTR